MPPQAKAKAKAKTRRVLAIDKYAQVPRDMQAADRLLDDRDLVKRTQKALDARRARDDRIDYVPAGGEQMEALAKKVEGMKKQMKAMGGRVRSDSPPRSRTPRRWYSGYHLPEPSVRQSASTSRATFAPSEKRQERLDRQMDREFMPSAFRAPSLDTHARVEITRALYGDARVAAARAALRGRRLT